MSDTENGFIAFFAEHGEAIGKFFSQNASILAAYFDKKTLAILGPVGVGKNCFYDRLRGLDFPKEPTATAGKEPIPTFQIKYTLPNKDQLVMYCKGCNVSGEENELSYPREHWKPAIEDVDIIFYVMDYESHFKTKKYQGNERVHRDIKWLASMMPTVSGDVKVHFFVNKIDTVIKDGSELEKFHEDHKAQIEEFKSFVKKCFGPYHSRLTGHVTPISLKENDIWAFSFLTAIVQIYQSVKVQ